MQLKPAIFRAAAFLLMLLTLVIGTPGFAQAATLTVTTTDDGFDGACDSHCTLREAIALALDGDTVDSVLLIERDITIRGSDLGWTTIQAAD